MDCNYFFYYIEKILLIFKDSIKNHYSNYEIFNIFKSNKKILLFDEAISNLIVHMETISQFNKNKKLKSLITIFINFRSQKNIIFM